MKEVVAIQSVEASVSDDPEALPRRERSGPLEDFLLVGRVHSGVPCPGSALGEGHN